MDNIKKFNKIFCEVFGVNDSDLNDNFNKDSVPLWDSVHQLNLVNLAEDTFDIMLDPEHIMEFTSYKKGLEIIRSQGIDI